MAARVDIGVHAQRDVGAGSVRPGDGGDALQLAR